MLVITIKNNENCIISPIFGSSLGSSMLSAMLCVFINTILTRVSVLGIELFLH